MELETSSNQTNFLFLNNMPKKKKKNLNSYISMELVSSRDKFSQINFFKKLNVLVRARGRRI